MRVVLSLSTLFAWLLIGAGAGAAQERAHVLVVGSGGAECPNADYTSIQAAVDAALPGAIVRVCPGLYPEAVNVTKTLTIRGLPDVVDSLDCFSPTLGELSPEEYAIVDPPGETATAFTLAANDVDLSGLVIQGGSVGVATRATTQAGAGLSGYRVHHNLIRHQRQFELAPGQLVGGYSVGFGAAGPRRSRVDHNCVRDNLRAGGPGWGIAAEQGDLIDARIDHNESYALNTGVELIGSGTHRAVRVDHNTSISDRVAIAVWTSSESEIVANESVDNRTLAIVVGGTNDGLRIVANHIRDGWRGIVFTNAFFPRIGGPVANVEVRDNVVTRMTTEGILAGPGFLQSSLLANNQVSGNLRDGILLRVGNAGNTVSGNVADTNGGNGIWAQGATNNWFIGNSMHGNGTAASTPPGIDARDTFLPGTTTLANTWIGNSCTTDFPVGAICPVG